MQNYAAGWNMGGYSPDPDNIHVTDDWQSAVAYLSDTIGRWWDQDYDAIGELPWGETAEQVDGRYLGIHTALHNAPQPPEWHGKVTLANGYDWHLWITETDEPADE